MTEPTTDEQRGFKLVKRVKENDAYQLPKRMTAHSAAYDFFSPVTAIIEPNGGTLTIATGIKIWMQPDEVFLIYTRSSWGIKYGITLRNNVAVLDSDYYDNPDNEGEVLITLINNGDEAFQIKKGDRFCQGLFQKYLVAGKEFDSNNERKGGVGSTGR